MQVSRGSQKSKTIGQFFFKRKRRTDVYIHTDNYVKSEENILILDREKKRVKMARNWTEAILPPIYLIQISIETNVRSLKSS